MDCKDINKIKQSTAFHSDKNLIILTGFFSLKLQPKTHNILIYNNLNKTNYQRNIIGIYLFKTYKMDLKTLNRLDTLRRLKSKGPKTPKWLKPYHLILIAFFVVFISGVFIKFLEQNHY